MTDMARQPQPVSSGRRRRRRLFLATLIVVVAATAGWVVWSERYPEQERELRVVVHERLEQWFPDEMSWPDGEMGFIARAQGAEDSLEVVLIHGLDEPGGIWDDLIPALETVGVAVREFRYPNDQAIDQSTDLLARHWSDLDAGRPVVLIGHSMGGLVIRDFVTRWLLPADGEAAVEGPDVPGVILIGTPNHGSEWARFRIFLSVRELLTKIPQQDFSLFSALREGTGAAKVDLRPGSRFLAELNERQWPESVPIRLIGGLISEPTPAMRDNLEAVASRLGAAELVDSFEAWWSDVGVGLGDGVVPLSSLMLPDAPEPVVVSASHRGMLTKLPLGNQDEEPPAIAVVIEFLQEWR